MTDNKLQKIIDDLVEYYRQKSFEAALQDSELTAFYNGATVSLRRLQEQLQKEGIL